MLLSPSNCRTSTMCSRILGPAMLPSLVMWPMMKIDVPVDLAYLSSVGAFAYSRHASRHESSRSVMVCIESITTRSGLCSPICLTIFFEQRLGIDQAFVVADSDPPRAHLDLLGRLLARDIERFQPVRRQCDLQREESTCRCPAPRPRGSATPAPSAAQHTVRLAVAHVYAVFAAMSPTRWGFAAGSGPAALAATEPLSRP